MSKVLVVEDHAEFRKIICFSLASQLGLEVLQAESFAAAKALMSEHADIDGVISNDFFRGGRAFQVYEIAQGLETEAFFVTYSSVQEIEKRTQPSTDGSRFRFVFLSPKQPVISKIAEVVNDCLRAQKKSAKSMQFIPVSLDYFEDSQELDLPLYLQLSSDHYVKVFKKGDSYTIQDQEHYKIKKVDQLFVAKSDVEIILKKLEERVHVLLLEQNKSKENIFKTSREALAFIHALAQELKPDPATQSLTQAIVQLAIDVIKKSDSLTELLCRVGNNDEKHYIVDHSLVLAYVCGWMAGRMGEKDTTLFKLAFAALLHDVAFYNPEHARLQTLDEIKISGLDEDEFFLCLNHPRIAADYVRNMVEIPHHVAEIIEQHHELPDGTGFPQGHNITKLNSLMPYFLIAHDYVSYRYENPQTDMSAYYSEAVKKFNVGPYKKILDLFVGYYV